MALLMIMAGAIWYIVRSGDTPRKSIVRQEKEVESGGSAHRTTADGPGAPAPAPGRARVLRPGEMAARHGLTQVEEFKMNRSLADLAFALLEERGLAATVREFDGRRLVLHIPGLKGGVDEIAARIERAVAAEVGAGRAAEIMSDPSGRETVLARLNLEVILAENTFIFEKVRGEGDLVHQGSLGHAKFELQITRTLDGTTTGMKVTEFDYSLADNYGLAWNAMAKAPAGYFRSQPILGVASRPPSAIHVYEEASSDKVEVRGLQGPGSKRVIDAGPRGG